MRTVKYRKGLSSEVAEVGFHQRASDSICYSGDFGHSSGVHTQPRLTNTQVLGWLIVMRSRDMVPAWLQFESGDFCLKDSFNSLSPLPADRVVRPLACWNLPAFCLYNLRVCSVHLTNGRESRLMCLAPPGHRHIHTLKETFWTLPLQRELGNLRN